MGAVALGLLGLLAGFCIGGILSGHDRARELSWVAMACAAGVVVTAGLVILT